MFRRSDKNGDGTAGDAPGGLTPPLKPFSAKGSHGTGRGPSRAGLIGESLARRTVDVPQAPNRGDRPRIGGIGGIDSRRLMVGREISLSGEITSCEHLTVEGRVEATLTDARTLDVAPTGLFRGRASVDEADIRGRFEGELIARARLTVRAGARLTGTIRYTIITIEPGGEVSGDMRMLAPGEIHSDDI